MTTLPSASLGEAIAAQGLEIPAEAVAKLDAYCKSLWEWNEKINLTRHTDYDKFVQRDLVDTLALSQFIAEGERILDVGTGGGVPGIPLAILRPDLKVSLCESVAKKAGAVSAIVKELGLKIPVHHERAETLLVIQRYDTLVLRAVASMSKILGWVEPHWYSFQRLLMLKGPAWIDERADARERGLMRKMELRRLHSYPLAGTDSESVVLQIQPTKRD